MLTVRLLGPVELHSEGGPVDPGPMRQRLVLAALAAERCVPVQIPDLIHRVWDDRPPQRAQHTLQVYLSRIRAVLARADPTSRIVRRNGGYALNIAADRIDIDRVRTGIAVARGYAEPSARSDRLEKALRWWQGPPMADLQGRWVEQVRQYWLQLRLDALIEWAGLRLAAGDAGAVLGGLSHAAYDFPLAEPLWAARMRALVAVDRRAEALVVYEAARSRLADELGCDPGPELSGLHRAILRSAPC
jgi:DNA-binding SARP family transcriptional activator